MAHIILLFFLYNFLRQILYRPRKTPAWNVAKYETEFSCPSASTPKVLKLWWDSLWIHDKVLNQLDSGIGFKWILRFWTNCRVTSHESLEPEKKGRWVIKAANLSPGTLAALSLLGPSIEPCVWLKSLVASLRTVLPGQSFSFFQVETSKFQKAVTYPDPSPCHPSLTWTNAARVLTWKCKVL